MPVVDCFTMMIFMCAVSGTMINGALTALSSLLALPDWHMLLPLPMLPASPTLP